MITSKDAGKRESNKQFDIYTVFILDIYATKTIYQLESLSVSATENIRI